MKNNALKFPNSDLFKLLVEFSSICYHMTKNQYKLEKQKQIFCKLNTLEFLIVG